MAKDKAPAKAPAKAPTTGVGKRTWRGRDVFHCLTPGCVFDHESEAVVKRHVALGAHRIRANTAPAPEPVAEPVADDEGGED